MYVQLYEWNIMYVYYYVSYCVYVVLLCDIIIVGTFGFFKSILLYTSTRFELL